MEGAVNSYCYLHVLKTPRIHDLSIPDRYLRSNY